MRPHSPANTRASGLARARMLMKAKLWWLKGYPRGDDWVVVPEEGERGPEVLTLDRNHLRRATFTANKLRGEFPRAMPKLVGDVAAWHAAVSGVLGTLKPWVHRGEALPDELWSADLYSRTAVNRARAMRREHPVLQPVVDALSWVLATRASLAPKYLAWVLRRADALTVVHEQRSHDEAVRLSIRCAHLAMAARPKAVEPLMRLLADPATYRTAIKGGRPFVEQSAAIFQRGGTLPEPAKLRLVPQIEDWVDWLLQVDTARAKRFLRLLEHCDLSALIGEWDAWWPALTRVTHKAHHIQAHEEPSKGKSDRIERLRRERQAIVERAPDELDLEGLTAALQGASADEPSGYHAAASKALRHVGESPGVAARAGLLIHFERLRHDDPGWEASRAPVLLRALAADLATASADDDAFAPWREDTIRAATKGSGFYGLLEDLLEEDFEARDIPRFFTGLAWLRRHAPEIDLTESAETLCAVVGAFHDGELAARLLVGLSTVDRHEQWCNADELRAAWMVAEPDVDVFARVFDFFNRREDSAELIAKALRQVLDRVTDEERTLLRALTLEEDIGALVSCGRKLAALEFLGAPLPSGSITREPEESDWIAEYPEELRGELERLTRFTPRARAIAAKVLRSVHRGDASIEAELRAVERMVSEASAERAAALRKRRATLKQRLASREGPATALSEVKRDTLRGKLKRRSGLALVAGLEEAAVARLRPALAEHYGLDSATPWLLEDRLIGLLGPLASESKQTRRLFEMLLVRRASDEPWDLRDHPANAGFIETLRQSPIDPGPWLDGIGEVVVGGRKASLRLSLEDDPLEVFHMGRHFGTCLSPGECNFFSVFANAADINKRVIYARDERGRVQGRRLVCLTQQGALLPFYPYAHDADSDFDEHSDAFVRRLAEAMGAPLVSHGSIPKLVAEDWYDDGPVDITGRYAELEDESAFRAALASVRPNRLSALLMETFGRTHVDEGLGPKLLALPELTERPELVVSLLPLLRHPERLPAPTCLQASRLLIEAGATPRVRSFFVRPLVESLGRTHRLYGYVDYDSVEFVARCAPTDALRLLRRTRARGVRSWSDETENYRLLAAAIAMETLRRKRQAMRLLRLALEAHGFGHLHEEAARRLKALEAELSSE
ncbi:MAG: hypothetical protein AAF799_34410 [Myxococcota bacterium]